MDLERKITTLTINSLAQIPALTSIRELPRDIQLILVFDEQVQNQRQTVGLEFKEELKGFQIGVYLTEPKISIVKLITDKEIEDNQLFFERCAKDYRKLSEQLIYRLADNLKITIDPIYPLQTFNPLKRSKKQRGLMNEWRYFLHGGHCGFEHKKTGQTIETPLIFGLEFGGLDPYFFTRFIKSTQEFRPLPVNIYEDYADGVRINEVMLSLGKFEKIKSDYRDVVVTDREKIKVEVDRTENKLQSKKEGFNFWKLIGLK